MRITFISDTHTKHTQITQDLPGGDLLIHAGDLMNSGYYWEEVYPFLDWYNNLGNYDHKVFIAGNHDRLFEDEAEKIKSQDDYFDKIKWIQENISTVEQNKENKEYINKFKSYILENSKEIKNKVEHSLKENKINNKKSVIKKQTWIYLFVKIITGLSNHYLCFGEEFFLLKLLYKYFPEIKFDYQQIYIIETYNDIDMCKEQGERYFNLINSLIKGDNKAFNGKEIEFFPSSYEKNKMSISDEIFSHIRYDIYNDGINWKDYEMTNIEY
jgi:hypothetical protein